MATEQSVDQVKSDLDRNSTELNGKCENSQPEVDVEKLENSKDANETGVCVAVIESREQSADIVVVSNRDEELSIGGEMTNGRASPTPAQDENGTDAMISAEPASDAVSSLGSQENDSHCVDSFGNEKASADIELNGDHNPTPVHEENGSDADLANASPVEDDPSALRRRRESLQQLCDVLMEERDRATSALKDKDGEVLRLRKRALEYEQEKGSLKSQLEKALARTVDVEKEMVIAKEENAKLAAEIVRLTKRIEELEAENCDLKSQLDKAREHQGNAEENGTSADSVESVTFSRVEELQEKPDSVVILSAAGGDEDQQQDEPKRAEAASIVDTKDSESGESEEAVRKRERAAQRSAPNFYRHSFTGSLPRPFHGFELPRQSSQEGYKERSGSFHSDASGESADLESGSVPSFMRRAEKPTFLKSGFSPVQFNYQPLPESISAHRRESWDVVRHASMMRARGGSLNMAHSVSSDWQISEVDSGARNHEPLECLSREQHANGLNAAQEQDDVDGGHGKREGEIETEKNGETSSVLSPGVAEHSENSKNSKDSNSEPTACTRENDANVPQQRNEHVESNDRSQVHAEGEEKRAKVSDLVNAWNNRTSEVFDV